MKSPVEQNDHLNEGLTLLMPSAAFMFAWDGIRGLYKSATPRQRDLPDALPPLRRNPV
jgi:hypothetical protein